MDEACSEHEEDEKIYTYISLFRKGQRVHLKDLDVDGRVKLKLILKQSDWRTQNGLVWLKTGTGGGVM
jgi:hypothetical protein